MDYVGCPLFSRSLLNEIRARRVNGQICDEKYNFYFEDTDFCEMAQRMGYKILNVYSAFSYHRRSATVTPMSANSYYYLKRGRIRFMIKYFSPIRLFLGSIWWLSTAAFDAFWYSAAVQMLLEHSGLQKTKWEPRNRVVIQAIYWNLANLTDHFKARKACYNLSNQLTNIIKQ